MATDSLSDLLEPGSENIYSIDARIQLSIAISLKRIADALAGDSMKLGVVDGVMSAIEQGLLAGLRR